jgi:hypothetical protein
MKARHVAQLSLLILFGLSQTGCSSTHGSQMASSSMGQQQSMSVNHAAMHHNGDPK